MKKFWNWDREAGDEGEEQVRILRLEGPIDNDNFWGDEITPQAFRSELEAEDGDVVVWINSPGGNVFAAAEIYTMLKDYKDRVIVKIASIAASAASVIAMAGDVIQMAPTALLMIHDPMTIAMGNQKEFEKAIATLGEVKESIINAYMTKTGLSHDEISDLMENETWMNARKAVELGFADEVLFDEKHPAAFIDPNEHTEDSAAGNPGEKNPDGAQMYQGRMMGQAIMNSLTKDTPQPRAEPEMTAVENQELLPSDSETTPVTQAAETSEKERGLGMPFDLLMLELECLK